MYMLFKDRTATDTNTRITDGTTQEMRYAPRDDDDADVGDTHGNRKGDARYLVCVSFTFYVVYVRQR